MSAFSGSDSANFCAVPVEVLTLGHTHHFTVTACLGMVRGGPSTSKNLIYIYSIYISGSMLVVPSVLLILD